MHVFVDGVIFALQKKGGISRIFHEVLPAMCELDDKFQVTLLAQGCDRAALPAHQRLTVVPAEDWSLSQWAMNPVTAKVLMKAQRYAYLAKFSPDVGTVWYSSYYTVPPRWPGPVVVLVADLIHELYPDFFPGEKNDAFRARKRRCITRADAVICISETTRQDLLKYYEIDPGKAHTARLAHNRNFYPAQSPEAPATGKKPFLLYIGTRVNYKNFGLLLRTYARWQEGKDVDLVLVGPALSGQEEQTIAALGVKGRVRVKPAVDDDELRTLYTQALAFVYPSIYEGFGIPLLEAMACGCPIIASDISSSREIAGDVPYYFFCNEEDGLIRMLNKVVGRENVAERVARGMARCRDYSWEKTARQTKDILLTVLEQWATQ